MRRALWILGLAAITGCDDAKNEASPSPREEQNRSFMRAMKEIDLAYERIHADLDTKKSPEEVKKHLADIRSHAEQASKLAYRASEAENRDLAFEFTKFLGEAARLESASWSGDDGKRAWRKLGVACSSCHELYREERPR